MYIHVAMTTSENHNTAQHSIIVTQNFESYFSKKCAQGNLKREENLRQIAALRWKTYKQEQHTLHVDWIPYCSATEVAQLAKTTLPELFGRGERVFP